MTSRNPLPMLCSKTDPLAMIDPEVIATEAFFLYAETYLPDETCCADTLLALESCAEGTFRETPGVGTYVFRRSANVALIGEMLFPGSVSLESNELYLTHAAFRDHLVTPEFRAGLRQMYKGTRRLGARLFWCGNQPPSDMLHNIFKSDPMARPLAPIALTLFNDRVYANSDNRDVAIMSVAIPLASGSGARIADAVDQFAKSVRHISLLGFFHPLDLNLLRLTAIMPLGATDDAQRESLANCLGGMVETAGEAGSALGSIRLHKNASISDRSLEELLPRQIRWSLERGTHSGYVSHPRVSTD